MLEPPSHWSCVVGGIHNIARRAYDQMAKKTITCLWNNIVGSTSDLQKIGINFCNVSKKTVESGNNTLFWQDEWRGGIKLKNLFLDYTDWRVERIVWF